MPIDPWRSMDFSIPIPDRIQAYLRSMTDLAQYDGYETQFFQHVSYKQHSESPPQMIYTMRIPSSLCNKDGNLHGGAASTILDNLSSTALFTIAAPGYWNDMGVSRSLNLMFYRPVPAGSKVNIICEVIATGKRMASMRAEIRTEDGKLCVTCVHDKVAGNPQVKL